MTSSVTIQMSSQTVQQLLQSGFTLYGFKAVQTSIGGGAPLVWYATQRYSQSTVVSWTADYHAYTSTSQIVPNAQIQAIFQTQIALGQTLQVQQMGIGQVVDGGTPGAISILNQTTQQFTTGIGQPNSNGPASLCAFPLFGNMIDVIAPSEQVLLMFATQPVNFGTVIFQAFAPGLLIDLTGVSSRNVTFDINNGWSAGGASWAQNISASSSLPPLLIRSSFQVAGVAGDALRADV